MGNLRSLQKKMKNIVLIGMRGSGKSSVGRALAKKLRMKYIDLDQKVEQLTGKKIAEIVAASGWEEFRAREKEAANLMRDRENTVIATGGGIVLDNKNVKTLKANGILILLEVSVEELTRRLARSDPSKRPSLTDKDLTTEIGEIWDARKERYYHASDIIIKNDYTGDSPTEYIGKAVSDIIISLGQKGFFKSDA